LFSSFVIDPADIYFIALYIPDTSSNIVALTTELRFAYSQKGKRVQGTIRRPDMEFSSLTAMNKGTFYYQRIDRALLTAS